MERLSPAALWPARASVIVLWLMTACVSVFELHGRAAALLHQTYLPDVWRSPLTIGGALLDAAVGAALCCAHRPIVYQLAAAQLILMTVAASALLPTLWLDPLGCLSKNLVVAALLWILYQDARQ
jgi:hypothetical protein